MKREMRRIGLPSLNTLCMTFSRIPWLVLPEHNETLDCCAPPAHRHHARQHAVHHLSRDWIPHNNTTTTTINKNNNTLYNASNTTQHARNARSNASRQYNKINTCRLQYLCVIYLASHILSPQSITCCAISLAQWRGSCRMAPINDATPLQKINGARTSTRIHIRPRSVLDPVLGARHEHARALTLRALAQRGEARCVASAMRGRSE